MNEGQINHLDKENFDLFKGILAAGIKEARIYYLKGELDKQANEIFAELKVLSENEIHSYLLDSLTYWQARFWLEQEFPSSQKEALKLLKSRGISPDRIDNNLIKIKSYLILSRVYLAENQVKKAAKIINRLQKITVENDLVLYELGSRIISSFTLPYITGS